MATEPADSPLAEFGALLRRRAWYFVTLVPGVTLVALFLAFWLAPTYRATATLMLEPSSIPQDLIKTTVATWVGEQIELVRGRVMASDKLIELIKRVDPYPDMTGATTAEKARRIVEDTDLEKVDPVTLKPLEDTTAFSIHYRNSDPYRAAVIAKELADLFVTYNRIARTETAEATSSFLKAQAEELSKSIREMDYRLAAFKDKFGGTLPGEQNYNQSELDRTRRDLDDLEQKLLAAQQHEQALLTQMSQMSPSLIGLTPDGRSQLALLKAQLAEASQRYTPNHPDVKRLQQQIAMLTGGSPKQNGTAPDNPAYMQAQTELNGVRSEIAALRARADRARNAIGRYEGHLRMMPGVEREYVDLVRDHDVAEKQFAEIQAKLGQAEISAKLETTQRGERFTLVRPPVPPRAPYSPNRLGLVLLGVILSAALAFGAAAITDALDPTVRSMRDLRDATPLAAIAAIPTLPTAVDRRRFRHAVIATAATCAVALAVVVMAIVQATVRERHAQERAAIQLRASPPHG